MFNTTPVDTHTNIPEINKTFEDLESDDLTNVVCILTEIILFPTIKCLPEVNVIHDRVKFLGKIILKQPQLIPNLFKQLIYFVFKPFDTFQKDSKYKYLNSLVIDHGSIITAETLLDENLSLVPFKQYFFELYEFATFNETIDYLIKNFYEIDPKNRKIYIKSSYDTANIFEDITLINVKTVHEYKLYVSLTIISKLITNMNSPGDSLELLLPYVSILLNDSNTCIDSVEYLFGKFARIMSIKELANLFLPTILSLLSVNELNSDEFDEEKKAKLFRLFDYSFLNQLRIHLGMGTFCNQIIPLLVEALSGLKDDFHHTQLLDTHGNESSNVLFDIENSIAQDSLHLSGETNDDPNKVIDSSQFSISKTAFSSFKRVISTLGPVLTCKHFCKNLLKMLALCYINPKCLNTDELNNPLNSLRPIEGDEYASNVLEALKAVSILYGEQVIVLQFIPHVSNTSDEFTKQRITFRLEASLISGIVLIYKFIAYLDLKLLIDNLNDLIYKILIPTIQSVSSAKLKFPNGHRSRQILYFKLLDIILLLCHRLGRELSHVQMETILRKYFDGFSALKANSPNTSVSLVFSTEIPNALSPKQVEKVDKVKQVKHKKTNSLSDIIKNRLHSASFNLISLKNEDSEYENEVSMRNVNDTYAENYDLKEEFSKTFTPELAHAAYFSISRYTSSNYVDSILTNHELIHELCMKHSKNLQEISTSIISNDNSITSISKSQQGQESSMRQNRSHGSSFNENINFTGNQIQFNISDSIHEKVNHKNADYLTKAFSIKFCEKDLKEQKLKYDTTRHLSEIWLAYWEQEIRSTQNNNDFDFKQINLTSLVGHTSGIKCIHSLDNESSIISGSKDKTVRLWSLRNQGGGGKKYAQSCQFTYTHHKKAVNSVHYVENLSRCLSSDGFIHAWDPFNGKKICQFEYLTQCMCVLPDASSYVACSSGDSLVKILDLRTNRLAYEYRALNTHSAFMRSINIHNDKILVGFSTGHLCCMDLRNGLIIDSTKSYDSEVSIIKGCTNNRFACAYSDGTIQICSLKDNTRIHIENTFKVHNDLITGLIINENQIISTSSSNRIGIHSNINIKNQISFSNSKLRSDNFSGIISSMTYLPMNRLVVLGSDNGDIRLFC